MPLSQRWTNYDGDQPVSDGTERDLQLGIARVEPPTTTGGANTMYYHTDHLGTTRLMSDSSGYAATGWHSTGGGPTDVLPSGYSAFGEHLSVSDPFDGESNRYGYVGAHGYQAHDQSQMRFLHVGHRYYDPGSGRFLQRDPIGIGSRSNVYAMVLNVPTALIDASGLTPDAAHNPNIPGDGPSSALPLRPNPPPQPPKPKPAPKPETPQEELDRINRRLNRGAALFAGCAAATFWFPPAAVTFGIRSAILWAGSTVYH